ncbi:FecR family protein [Reyranella sp.]|uniref:FecR family protein n=1 Tax=Reyranella sp. TaxID=1929291 RepID=UPI003BA87A2A
MNGPGDRQDEIEDSAALWAARLGEGPIDADAQRRLARWLAEDPRHRAAFAEAQAAWRLMEAVARSPGDALAATPRPLLAKGPAKAAARWWRPAMALAASLLVLVAGAIAWQGDLVPLVAADYRTAPGERRTVALADGSRVELGPHSAIALRFDARERRIELLQGLAYFIAAPRRGAEERPFVVQAGTGRARALGTEFEVQRLSGAAEVTVVEHEVAVAARPADAAADAPLAEVVLSPGQSVRYSAAGLGPVRAADLDRALAWRRDRLVFDRAPLAEVVETVNLYRRGRIVLGSAALAQRRVSGVFDMTDPDAVLAAIARELGAHTVSAPLVTLLY